MLMLVYVRCPDHSLMKASFLDPYEYFVIPISKFVLLLTLNTGTPIPVYVAALGLFALQCVLIWAKIFYCGTIDPALTTVSKEFRMLRIIRLILSVILAAVFRDQLPLLVILGLLQLTSPIAFMVKFTFLRANRELFLFIAVAGGAISTFEAIISAANQSRYFFLGEIVGVSFYCLQRQLTVPFVRLLELKYHSHLRRTTYKRSADDQLLIRYSYIKECLLPNRRTLNLS